MSWIENLEPGELRHWIRCTSTPMMASMPDGKILWCNPACEAMTGYTVNELTRADWRSLTDGPDDLIADLELAREVESGTRTEYRINKAYRTKYGPSKRVIIHVLRNPLEGPFKFCLVSIYPLDGGFEMALDELKKQQVSIIKLLSAGGRPAWLNQYFEAFKTHPMQTIAVTVSILAFIFGNRVLEIVAAVQKMFTLPPSGGSPP